MRILFFFILVLCSRIVNAQTTNFTINKIPYSDPEIRRPGAGAEDWQGQNTVRIPTETNVVQSFDYYVRSWFTWAELETGNGVYDFDGRIGPYIRTAINRRQKFSFGIMTIYDDGGEGINVSPTDQGAGMSYPLYVHQQMQALTANNRDFIRSGWWIPNYNSAPYLDRLDSLHANLARWLENTSFNGVRYKDVIGYIDIRGFGNYGEWHHVGYVDRADQADGTSNSWPTGRRPTLTSLQRIVDSHCDYLGDYQLVAMVASFDAERLWNTWNPPGIASYILDKTYGGGKKIGIRRDNWASTDQYILDWMDNNNRGTLDGQTFGWHIMRRWRYAPINGEPYNFGDGVQDNNEYATLEAEVIKYRVSSFGNGNFVWSPSWSANSPNKTYVRNASKRSGPRITLNSGSMTTTVANGVPFNITLTWANEGITPLYTGWRVRYQVRTLANQTVATFNSSYNLRSLFPDSTATVSENFTLSSVPAGTYRLHLIVEDSIGYLTPYPIHITNRQSDGSYILRTDITVTSTGNLPPTANAGVDQTITLPTSSVTLSGSGSDADGSIASYQWTRVSGPNTPSFGSATSASTNVSGLIAGTYVFRLTVTDNQGATGTDDITVTVNASAPGNTPPVVNAGANQVIQLPTSFAFVSGSATDNGSVVAYEWTKVSGPAGGNILNPLSDTTTINNLQVGVYVFRLTAADDAFLTASDDIQITVTAANVSPTANAGTDRTVTLPTNTTSLTGSGTDSDGTITAYLWTKVSGPSGGAISSPNAASTSLTGLLQGVYVYRLRVTDNQGATATDDVQITVNPAPDPDPDGDWIFTSDPSPSLGEDFQGVVLGVKFTSSQAGAITRMRFWKEADNDGTNIAAIYTAGGALLWSDTIVTQTASGWQYINTDTVEISANTTYVAAVYMSAGVYSLTGNYFANSVTNGVLTAPSSSSSGGNGVYVYNEGLAFPNQTFNASNYWIDVFYQTTSTPPANVPPVVSAGFDKSIRLPLDSVQLQGIATDEDGSIVTVDWFQMSGPSTATISDTASLTPWVTGLQQGVYQFLLTVTDDDGATSTDFLVVTVDGVTTNWRKRRTYQFNGRVIRFRR